jgi:hypothetical protein
MDLGRADSLSAALALLLVHCHSNPALTRPRCFVSAAGANLSLRPIRTHLVLLDALPRPECPRPRRFLWALGSLAFSARRRAPLELWGPSPGKASCPASTGASRAVPVHRGSDLNRHMRCTDAVIQPER